jgi:hypothetical protein
MPFGRKFKGSLKPKDWLSKKVPSKMPRSSHKILEDQAISLVVAKRKLAIAEMEPGRKKERKVISAISCMKM